ncbi:MAG TPA: PQQ-binding-like beta-propeller repeat protein [Candidatus Limnocylindrales bacterium]|nr:PQQ-binding-like beta-propeller repeat protein [Candidatus Limnocylindrales bacterium]
MKIQCACGAKYAFDATPEMLQNPVKFVCPGCGLDSSDFVNELIRREFAGQTPAAPSPATETPRLKIARPEPQPSAPVEATPESPAATEYCSKHPREVAVHHCVICGKPMCHQCMGLFGHVCSPFCRARAEAQNIQVSVFAGQKTVAEARYWRKIGRIGGAAGFLVAAGLVFWTWYAWVGSVPHTTFSVHFDDIAYTGESRLCGMNQIVFLHGGTLARYDIKSGKEVWSQVLVTKQQIADMVARENQMQPTDRSLPGIPESQLEERAARDLEGSLQLRVSGENVWVATPGKLTHYDWDTGKMLQEIPLVAGAGELIARNGEFLIMGEGANGRTLITHLNPATGESRAEEIGQPGQTLVAATAPSGSASSQATAGLPLAPGTGAGRPMNPAKVGEQAQHLSLPARIALPALLANSSEQERLQAELNDQNQPRSRAAPAQQPKPVENEIGHFTLIPSQYSYVEFAVRLLKSEIVTREAMKASSGKSALNGNVSTANESAAVNETLNEMQRSRGGDTVQEDESLYQVSLRRPDSTGAADWTGEVIGPPALFPLKTVNVLVAGKTLIVFDQTNKKLWQATLTYDVPVGSRDENEDASPFGEGPCVEHSDTLYVFDQAVLTAFDLATGNARWRLPTVGVVGLFFDDHGMLYVNTTTADPENIRYSRQIDITQKIQASLLKIDPQTGQTLWKTEPGGFISYLSKNYIYTVQIYNPSEEENKMADLAGITPNPAHIWIRRINPQNGQVMWKYYQADKGAILNVQFKDNSIELVFKKEVDVLKYLAL